MFFSFVACALGALLLGVVQDEAGPLVSLQRELAQPPAAAAP